MILNCLSLYDLSSLEDAGCDERTTYQRQTLGTRRREQNKRGNCETRNCPGFRYFIGWTCDPVSEMSIKPTSSLNFILFVLVIFPIVYLINQYFETDFEIR